jgi:high-affinity Fe2+/Pb2+ permease
MGMAAAAAAALLIGALIAWWLVQIGPGPGTEFQVNFKVEGLHYA